MAKSGKVLSHEIQSLVSVAHKGDMISNVFGQPRYLIRIYLIEYNRDILLESPANN